MTPQIISRQEIIDDDQVTRWYFSKDGINEINLGNLLEEDISKCDWLDEQKTILLISYIDGMSYELRALVSPNGQVLRKGIYCVEKFFEELGVVIVSFTGYGLDDLRSYYCLEPDDYRMALLNLDGEFLITPEYNEVYFEEEENCFYSNRYGRGLVAYAFKEGVLEKLPSNKQAV